MTGNSPSNELDQEAKPPSIDREPSSTRGASPSDRRTDEQPTEPVVSQDFVETKQTDTTDQTLQGQPQRVQLDPVPPRRASSTSTSSNGLILGSSPAGSIKLPPPPASPSQASTKLTTTPPTPGSLNSVGTGSTGRTLDEFGLPRISPPRGYFDGDNEGPEESTVDSTTISHTEEGDSRGESA